MLQLEAIKRNVTTGWEKIFASHDEIDKSFESAQSACSSTRIVDACKGSFQIHLESLKYSMETCGAEVAEAFKRDILEHEDDVKQLQHTVLDKAESIITTALGLCTSPQQARHLLSVQI